MRYWLLSLVGLGLLGCSTKKSGDQPAAYSPPPEALFETLPPSATGINFANNVVDDADFNIFSYRNFYNGAGVAIGDVNKDGLPDVFLTANQGDNKLFLNKGNFKFEDITAQAGVAGQRGWSTGVTFADVNGDGWVDIYVCNAGSRANDDRANELFINNGASGGKGITFTERASEYGLADRGYSTHAAFFDYDRDGDLDMYLLNNSFIPVGRLGYQNLRTQRDSLGGDKLFRNDGPGRGQVAKFTDVSQSAGIYGSLIGFGLGITIGDVNNDNWLDIYISNDFYERDYLYINQKDGTFLEASKDWMAHESLSSMGADIADLNNDGLLDIFVTDMLPWNDYRLKTTSTFEGYDLFQLKLERDFHYQYMQNMLHLNNGDGTFSEIARLAGTHATDWSWGALLFDMDSDGNKDIFVANGIAKNLTDQDFVSFLADEKNMEQMARGKKFNFKEFLDMIKSERIPNYAFRNEGGLRFANHAVDWGLAEPSFSNGSAYGDLDNDGDLDLIVNNNNSPVSIYKNRSVELRKTHFLRVKLQGTAQNQQAIGAKVTLYQPGNTQLLQQMPNRGFQSSVDHVLVFGLGQSPQIDSLEVIWPDDRRQVLAQVKADTELVLDQQQANGQWRPAPANLAKPFADVTAQTRLDYAHQESNFIDFKRDALLKQRYSTLGPALATGDVNGDGLADVYLGGAVGAPKKLYFQLRNGTFVDRSPTVFLADTAVEAVDAVLVDVDNDNDLDLFVVTGSNEFLPNDPNLQDRLYLNDGKGGFVLDNRLPNLFDNGSCVAASDFDRDGDIDLFVGGRMIVGQYGLDPPSYLFVNDGTGEFKNYTKRYLGDIKNLGMVTAASWADLDGDQFPELIVVGDWMAVTVFKNLKGSRLELLSSPALAQSEGWWNTVHPADLDGDGDLDLVLGNLGLNSRIKASKTAPAELYISDFDQNGEIEQIITCQAEDGKNYPMVLKADLQAQMPGIKKKFLKFADYGGKSIQEIFSADSLKTAIVKKVYQSQSVMLINDGNFNFTIRALPIEAQYSPIRAVETLDYDGDGVLDVLLTGNFYDVVPEIGRYDANFGLVLKGLGKGAFQVQKPSASGFLVKGQVRRSSLIRSSTGQTLIVLAKNNDRVQVVKVNPVLRAKAK